MLLPSLHVTLVGIGQVGPCGKEETGEKKQEDKDRKQAALPLCLFSVLLLFNREYTRMEHNKKTSKGAEGGVFLSAWCLTHLVSVLPWRQPMVLTSCVYCQRDFYEYSSSCSFPSHYSVTNLQVVLSYPHYLAPDSFFLDNLS